jgi:hypothetical protein
MTVQAVQWCTLHACASAPSTLVGTKVAHLIAALCVAASVLPRCLLL